MDISLSGSQCVPTEKHFSHASCAWLHQGSLSCSWQAKPGQSQARACAVQSSIAEMSGLPTKKMMMSAELRVPKAVSCPSIPQLGAQTSCSCMIRPADLSRLSQDLLLAQGQTAVYA